jgi:hypothetical protein
VIFSNDANAVNVAANGKRITGLKIEPHGSLQKRF